VVSKSQTPSRPGAIKDCHWTLIGWTSLSGKLVGVTIIFAGSKLEALWEMGVDVFADCHEAGDIRINGGPSKAFSGGPACISLQRH